MNTSQKILATIQSIHPRLKAKVSWAILELTTLRVTT